MENDRERIFNVGAKSGNTPLHLACLKGSEKEICALLDEKDHHVLYRLNKDGLSPIFCLSDVRLRNFLLNQYPHVCDAFSNQVISVMRQVVNHATTEYCINKENSLFKYGFYRAREFDKGLEISMDPFNGEKAVKTLQEMIVHFINHLERIEGYYGFRHKGNLYKNSQDTLLIQSFYFNQVLSRTLDLEPLDTQSLHLPEYRELLREKLLTHLKTLDQLLWSIILPDVVNEFMLI